MPQMLETAMVRLKGTGGKTLPLRFGPIETKIPHAIIKRDKVKNRPPMITQAVKEAMAPLKRGEGRVFVYRTSKMMPWKNFYSIIANSAHRMIGTGKYTITRETKNTIRVYRTK